MARSTYNITLKAGTDALTLTKLVDIKDFPSLGGAPEMLETTTLSDAAQTYIQGIQASDAMEFTYNYDDAVYDATVTALLTAKFFSLEFGDAGVDGKFDWQGKGSTWIEGAGTNAVIEAKLSIAPSTVVTKATV